MSIFRKIGSQYVFFIAVVLVYILWAVFDLESARAGFNASVKLMLRIAPTLGVVFALLFVSSLIVDARTVARYLGEGARAGGWLLAIGAGIISAGPIYLWYPLLSDLKEKGMREALIAVFLYNRAVKIPLLPLMIQYFGVRTVAVLTIYMVAFSVLNGFLVERILKAGRNRTCSSL